jgi:AcrR family transcriptional regulator
MLRKRTLVGAAALSGPPIFHQRRAADSYEALLRAAAAVFASHGFEGAQTPLIAAEAGVATGTFYRYFKDKRQAFLAVMASRLQQLLDETRLRPELFAGTDLRGAVEHILDYCFDLVRRDAPLYRVMLSMSFSDPEVAQLRALFEAEERALLASFIEQLIPAEVIPNARAAALVIQLAAMEVAAERAGLRPRHGRRTADKDTRWALREMICRFLLAPPTPKSSAGAQQKEPKAPLKRGREEAARSSARPRGSRRSPSR